MQMRGFRKVAAAAAVVAALGLPAIAAGSGRATLAGNAPGWATPGNRVGAANPSDRVGVRLVLGWRDAAGLAASVRSSSDPSSPSYHHYLTPAQFFARFSPSASDYATAASWLKGQGFRVSGSPTSRLWVSGSGTVAQAEAAFGVKLGLYRFAGRIVRAPDGSPSIPSSLAGIVKSVAGLDGSFMRPTGIASDPDAPPPAAFVTGTPCSKYWAAKVARSMPPAYGYLQTWNPCGYTPRQLESAYGVRSAVSSGNDGTGVTVAILDAFNSKTIKDDANTYASLHHQPAVHYHSTVFCPCPGSAIDKQDWSGEQTLDVEAVHAMAPGAKIYYVGSHSSDVIDFNDAMAFTLDNAIAQIVNNSYGNLGENLPQGIIDQSEALYVQAAAEGIGIYFSSGDGGDEVYDLGYRTTDYPASSPNVTAVGGTSLGVGAIDEYRYETAWGTWKADLVGGAWSPDPPGYWLYGGGGGTSRIFAEPWYQVGVVPDQFSGYFGGSGRVVPDISTDGDPSTGMVIGQTQTFPDGTVAYSEYRIGGTSLSSPLFAGIMALADQRAGYAHGFVNPALYALFTSTPDAFRDVTVPATTVSAARSDYANDVNGDGGRIFSLRTMGQVGTLASIAGYDDSTGAGSPNGDTFLNGLS